MGWNAIVYVEIDGPIEEIGHLNHKLEPLEDYLKEENPESTHELADLGRYFHKHYTRKPWDFPYVAHDLLTLFRHPSVKSIRYGFDGIQDESQPLLSKEDFLDLIDDYITSKDT